MAINMTFVDFVTPVPADWLNNVNTVVNTPFPVTSYTAPFTGAVNRTSTSKWSDVVSVLDFAGVDPTGVADSTAGMQAAHNTGHTILYPPGTYKFSSITITQGGMVGTDSYNTILECSQAASDAIVCSGTQALIFENLTFSASVTRTANSFINFTGVSGFHLIRRNRFVSPWIGVNFTNSNIYAIEDNYFASHITAAIQIQDVASPDAGDSQITGNVFDTAVNTAVHINQYSSGGLRVINNKFLGAGYHYLGQFNTGVNPTSILILEGNSSEAAFTTNFAINSSNNTSFSKVIISNNQMSVNSTASGISIQDPGYVWIDDVEITGNNIALGGGPAVAMNIARSTRLSLGTNHIVGNNSEAGIVLLAGVTSGIVAPQHMYNLGTYWSGPGLANVTFSPGRREFGTSAATINTSVGSVFVSSPVTVTFAQPYAVAPSVMLTPITANNVFGASITSGPTTTGFTYQAWGASNSVTAQIYWQSHG